jgi:hypothetical protein
MESLLDHSERYLTRLLYKTLFCPHTCDDEERDLAVQKRIRSLNWISAPLLDCRINELDSKVRDILEKAITRTFCHKLRLSSSKNNENSSINLDLIEMDGQRAPQDKLASIINCSKLVFEMLGLSHNSNADQSRTRAEEESSEGQTKEMTEGDAVEPTVYSSHPVSADDFLPALIYVVLRANPPRIHSNLNFITRYYNNNSYDFFCCCCCRFLTLGNFHLDLRPLVDCSRARVDTTSPTWYLHNHFHLNYVRVTTLVLLFSLWQVLCRFFFRKLDERFVGIVERGI